MQQSHNSLAAEWLSAVSPAAWHAGGQRFESAWLHIETQASPGFFDVWAKPLALQSGL